MSYALRISRRDRTRSIRGLMPSSVEMARDSSNAYRDVRRNWFKPSDITSMRNPIPIGVTIAARNTQKLSLSATTATLIPTAKDITTISEPSILPIQTGQSSSAKMVSISRAQAGPCSSCPACGSSGGICVLILNLLNPNS